VCDILSLLALCLKATYFSFRGTFYQQVFGTAMGSPVSVVVANLVMEDVENRALTTLATPPKFWKRYVDDVCSVVRRQQLPLVLCHINSIEPSIQFTQEIEGEDGCLPFLDILLKHCGDGSDSTSVPTHTNRYLDFMSHHPKAHKAAVVRTLFSRADSLSSTALSGIEERQSITQALRRNNYPDLFVKKTSVANHSASSSEQQQPRTSIVVPYVRGLSETLKRILAEMNIRVVHQPHITLRRKLVHVKDPVPPEKASGVVYSISCRECSDTYIGQTGRLLGTRLAEHRAAVKYSKTDVSAVAEHVWERQHSMNFDGTTILAREHDVHRRYLLESWFIQRSSTINREVGPLPQLYRCLF